MLLYLERVSKVKVQSGIATAGTAVNLLTGVHVWAEIVTQPYEANLVLIRAAAVAKEEATTALSTLVTRTEKHPVVIGVCWESP